MNYFTIFTLSFTIALSGALAPGPLLAAVISQSGRHGAKTGPLFILGHAAAELAMVALIALGFAQFMNDPAILLTIALAGAGILVYFGISLLLSVRTASLEPSTARHGNRSLALMGVTLSLSNPYWSIWWLTIGMGLVLAAQKRGLAGIAVFFLGHILADLAWYSFISFSLSKSARHMDVRFYRTLLAVCAILLMGFGVWFAAYALTI
ncbi:MAG TPA: LysE family transporter [Candidatus Omnitrophota bacterium]|nr:LysE family transporter [Candidatus Omnitrophota bacterium]HQO37220.1 LysE family transporter [Candidatus Omnitrophota bacterium]HQQ05385.1 LysE family transporter [Candidatus Omnitrophota bacterium]